MKKIENNERNLFCDRTFFKKFLRSNIKITLITSYPGFDMVVRDHVFGEEKCYPEVYLFKKKAVFDFLVKINCKFEKKTGNVFWITAR